MDRLSSTGRAYVIVVAAFGAATLAQSVHALYLDPLGWNWLTLAILTLLSGSATVKLPSVPATISVSETFVFTSALLFGPAAGTATVALDALVISLWLARRGHPIHRIAFNVFALPASMWVGAHLYYAIGQVPPLSTLPPTAPPVAIATILFPLVCFATVYYGLNSALIAIAISFERGASPVDVWKNNFAWLSLNYFGGASVAALLVTYTKNIDYTYLAFVLPLLAALYFTFAFSMGRVEDANRHLSQLNTLYMSTIETLAMAIDAKDQITHGHIRRVQQYAVGLARRMGVSDDKQIKAIEAASLLHDMGKLAVPEYILNKPGRLTPAEFEKMKLHASVGADILSAIDFPYPVVPIVRHHHENWDGTGYPDGIKGSDIPIGARILSVVDCFDALTSDRPYRPRLPDVEAIRILIERRGTMYDPLIVDTFIRIHTELVPESPEATPKTDGLRAITQVSVESATTDASQSARLSKISASTEEMLVLYELAQGLTAHLPLQDVAELIAKYLRRVVPASTIAFFGYDSSADELTVTHAAGEGASHFAGLRIPRGQRLTGWVAANRQSILNSDPALDLGEAARSLRPPLRSCLSTPLLVDDHLVGVLTVYSPIRDAFTEDHRRVLEVIGGQISQSFHRAVLFQSRRLHSEQDSGTGLPNVKHLERVVANELSTATTSAALSIILIKIGPPASAHPDQWLPSSGVLAKVAEYARGALRGADLLFHFSAKELAILLLRTNFEAARQIADRVARCINANAEEGLGTAVEVVVGVASAPDDGLSLDDLLRVAERREPANIDSAENPPSIH
jgi:diguanylate cyclase (GGDEF)-like protein/putative nucleotidyltransferase with HDIG domain